MSMSIASISIGGIISSYSLSFDRAQWSAYSSAAQRLTLQRVEQTKSARWTQTSSTAIDELVVANFPVVAQELAVPNTTTNAATATITTTITDVNVTPPMKLIRVETVWSYRERGPFTNEMVTIRTPAN